MNQDAIFGKKPMEEILEEYRKKHPVATEVIFNMNKIDFDTLEKFTYSLNPSNFDFSTVKDLNHMRLVLTDFYDKFAVLGGLTKVNENIREREKIYVKEFRRKEFEEEEDSKRKGLSCPKCGKKYYDKKL
jgi:hypothetical protein